MSWYEWIIESTEGALDLVLLKPLRILLGLGYYIVSFWTWLFWLIAIVVFSIGGIYVIITALIMVFSINTKDPFKMLSDIGKNLMIFNIFLLQAIVEITKIGLAALAIIINGIISLIPFKFS